MKPLLVVFGFFVAALILGIFSGQTLIMDLNKNPYLSAITVPAISNDISSAVILVVSVIAFAVILFVAIHWLEAHVTAFKGIEFIMVAVSSMFIFYSVLRLFLGYAPSTVLAIIFGLVFGALEEIRRHTFKNVAALLIASGVGVIFGLSMSVWGVIIFLVLLAIYDYIAVFSSKDMLGFADFLVSKEIAFSVSVVNSTDKKGKAIDLGVGDMIAPVMFSVAALSHSPMAAVFVFAGAAVSMILFSILTINSKKPVLPGIPAIAAGTIFAYGIGAVLGFYPF